MVSRTILLSILIVILTLIFILPQAISHKMNGDAKFHLNKILDTCTVERPCNAYPGLYHRVASFFVYDKDSFVYFNLLLFFVLFPIVFYFFCDKNKYAILFAIIGTGFSLRVITESVLPAGLAIICFLLFLKTKSVYTKILLFIIGIGLHNWSFSLFFITGLFQSIEYFFKNKDHLQKLSLAVFSLPNFNQSNRHTPLFESWITGIFPVYLVIGFDALIKQKNFLYVVLVFFSFIYSIEFSRAELVGQLLLLSGFVSVFSAFDRNKKLVLVLGGIVFWLFMLGYYIIPNYPG